MESTFDAKKVDEFIERYGRDSSSLIQVLQDVQGEYRYLPKDAMIYVSERLGVPTAQTFNVATFYNAFSLNPIGKRHVCVCMGTACHVRGSATILDSISSQLEIAPGRTTPDGEFTLDTVNCVGACSLAPIVLINDVVHAGQSAAGAKKLIGKELEKAGKGPKKAEKSVKAGKR